MSGHTSVFHPHTQKLEQICTGLDLVCLKEENFKPMNDFQGISGSSSIFGI